MILMGDEIGRSQGGNNNSWCQNNLLGWMNWDHAQQDLELLEYFKYVIKIRKKLINIFNPSFLPNYQNHENIPIYQWHGTKLDSPDWSIETDFSFTVKGPKILDMLVSITFNQLYLHFGKGKSILFEYAFKPIQTNGLLLPLLMLKTIV